MQSSVVNCFEHADKGDGIKNPGSEEPGGIDYQLVILFKPAMVSCWFSALKT